MIGYLYFCLLCTCDKNEEEPLTEMYICIDGDLRQINDVGVPLVGLGKSIPDSAKGKLNQATFNIFIYDPEKKAIDDIGSF